MILHLDLDAFFCSVEELLNPELRGRPFAVGGRPETRGVVASCSYPARAFGVRSAMPMARALRLCPELRVIPGRYAVYREFSQRVMDRLHALTPQVEQVSIDEAFLAVAEGVDLATATAHRLQAEIRDEVELPCSIGVATNKLMAKLANEVGKSSAPRGQPPYAITVVSPGEEAAFLAPLPVGMLWGVGPKTAAKLEGIGIQTIGALAALPEVDLLRRFGQHGLEMGHHARGLDTREIVLSRPTKSISQEITFDHDVRSEGVLRAKLYEMAAEVARSLQEEGLAASTVRLKLRWPDFTTLTRQTTLGGATDRAEVIGVAVEGLFYRVWQPGQAVRLLGVGATRLSDRRSQLGLWEPGTVGQGE